MTRHLGSLVLGLALFTVLMGCAAPPRTGPTKPPSSPVVPITTPAGAMAAVVVFEPRLAGIGAKDPNLIGQAAWYEAVPASGVGAFVVKVEVGWGDCPAGCIDRHTWQYAVAPDGAVTLMSEQGSPLAPGVLPSQAKVTTGILVRATAGPVCPVEQNPPDPNCAARPVGLATVVVLDPSGSEVSRAMTAADGTVQIGLAAGNYVVQAAPVEGYMGTPAPVPATVVDGQLTIVELGYDTGIR